MQNLDPRVNPNDDHSLWCTHGNSYDARPLRYDPGPFAASDLRTKYRLEADLRRSTEEEEQRRADLARIKEQRREVAEERSAEMANPGVEGHDARIAGFDERIRAFDYRIGALER